MSRVIVGGVACYRRINVFQRLKEYRVFMGELREPWIGALLINAGDERPWFIIAIIIISIIIIVINIIVIVIVIVNNIIIIFIVMIIISS